jgi:hypothetical protein
MLEEVVYTAEVYIGGIDRVWIYRADPFTNTCAKLSIRHDYSNMPQFDIVTPMDWTFEYVQVHEGLDCEAGQILGGAIAATGSVQFNGYDPMQDAFPCDVDVDAQFETDQPAMVDFLAAGLVPQGAGC